MHRDTTPDFAPSSANLLTTLLPPVFGTTDGRMHYTDSGAAAGGYFYVVRSCTAVGACSDARAG